MLLFVVGVPTAAAYARVRTPTCQLLCFVEYPTTDRIRYVGIPTIPTELNT